MTTLTDHPPETPGPRDLWLDALKSYAIGRTAETLRAMADDPEWTRGMAALSGTSPDEERQTLLSTATAIEALVREGLTPEKCYYLAGLDRVLGEYLPWDGALFIAAGLMRDGRTSAELAATQRPEVVLALGYLEDLGITRSQAAEITETAVIPAVPSPRAAADGTPAAA